MRARWPAGLVALAALGVAAEGHAFCRTKTCDVSDPTEQCTTDRNGCIQEGRDLVWPEKCLSFGVEQSGSPLRGISFQAATRVVQDAFRQWMSVDCGGGQHPSFLVWDLGEPFGGIVCDRPEFNNNEPNANVWMFRDDGWPYTGANSTLALTTITFEVPTGQILDADVELNSSSIDLSTSDEAVENDLLSIATHEAGHFLGLAHSHVPTATMNANYSPGDASFRTLHADDAAGICAAYPPNRNVPACSSPRPRHGFSRYCAEPVQRSGCTVAPESPDNGLYGTFALAALGLAGLGSRLRRQKGDGRLRGA